VPDALAQSLVLLTVPATVGLGLFGVRTLLSSAFLWWPSIQAFGETPPCDVVFTGSSSITYWASLEADMAPLRVVNRGFGGSMIRHAARYAERLVGRNRPRAIVISAGSNDLAFFFRVSTIERDFRRFVAAVHAIDPEIVVYFVSINRAPARLLHWRRMSALEARVRAMASSDPRVRYLDVSGPVHDAAGRPRLGLFRIDGLHMNEAGYAAWTSVIRPRLLADLALERERTHTP
jgi:lysophospholipase L1-like esterase